MNILDDDEIKQYLIGYTDIRGVQRAKLVPSEFFEKSVVEGVGFAGFASWLNMQPSDSDVIAIPDVTAGIKLPWKSDTAWIPADLYVENQPLEQNPRQILKRLIETAANQNVEIKTGVEAEFMLLKNDIQHPASVEIFDRQDLQLKPCYDQQTLHRNLPFIERLVHYINLLGWGCYQADHEDANGQYEINWGYENALITSDRHSFFKFMVRSLAPEFGARATFMPKPFNHLTGNGCHCHVSCWSVNTGHNLFTDVNTKDFSRRFADGLTTYAAELSLLTNPSTNSYKRLHPARPQSGASWTPATASFGGNDRTVMVRVPDVDRLETRLPDGSANPYLLQASIIAAGLGDTLFDINKADNPNEKTPREPGVLPRHLGEAIGRFEQSQLVDRAFHKEARDAILSLKKAEWGEYLDQITSWESKTYLDC